MQEFGQGEIRSTPGQPRLLQSPVGALCIPLFRAGAGGLVSLTLRLKASSSESQGATWDSEELWEEWERPTLGLVKEGHSLWPLDGVRVKNATRVRRPNALWVETGPSSSLFLGGAQGPSG